jgi:hypothetical protein
MATEAQNRAKAKYQKKTYDTITLRYRKEDNMNEKFKEHCLKYGYTDEAGRPNVKMFISKAIETQMNIDRN